jgi:hypothetical protein
MPRWDNTARKGIRAHIFHGSTPGLFERWLRRASLDTRRRNPGAPLVFVNSWNEWAEGAHLEADDREGRRYLDAVQRVVTGEGWSEESAGAEIPKAQVATPRASRTAGRVTPVTSLRPGLPDQARLMTEGDGRGWIEEVGGRPLLGSDIDVTCDQVARLRGWFYCDVRAGGRHGAVAYILVSRGGVWWHAPITERHRRPDVLRGVLAADRRRRKLVRLLDRLPGGTGARVLSPLTGSRDRLGFDILLRLDGLPPGTWSLTFAEATTAAARVVSVPFVLRCGA